MKVPLSWLREFVDFDLAPEALAERLTFSGTEVESVERVGHDYTGVVVGEILSIAAHPRADRLKVCQVSTGREVRRVVCGAPNLAVGDRAPLALAGARLPGGITVQAAVIRGEASEGMLCAEDELGISADHSGLMRVDRRWAPGTPFVEVTGAPDVVLDLAVTWNRPDCLSMVGVAREVAALVGAKLRMPCADVAEGAEAVEQFADVRVEDAVGCPRYTARILQGVVLKPSPLWMQRRLTLCGVRPIVNVVDVTNYVMIETGHPLHAFDYELISGHRIVVRRAKPGESIATLDGLPRAIVPDDLLIADAHRPVAIAGIMGGAGSEIREETRTVLLESAAFDPAVIHRTSARLGLATESSRRFERGVSVPQVEWAGRRAARLICEVAEATVAQGCIDVYPSPRPRPLVALRYRKVNETTGMVVRPEEVSAILESLQVPVVETDAWRCTVLVPDFRLDLEVEADLIEEVARMKGLQDVPAAPPQAIVVEGADDAPERAMAECRRTLAAAGLTEIVNYSFVSAALLDSFDASASASRVALPNPVAADYGLMRDSLLPQMVQTLGNNLAHGVGDAALFEIGRVFRKDTNGAIGEAMRLSLGFMGKVGRSAMDVRKPVSPEEMFLWAKGALQSVSDVLHAGDLRFSPVRVEWMEGDGATVAVSVGDKDVGVLGLVGQDVRRRWRMVGPVAVAELRISELAANVFRTAKACPLPGYPSIVRDVAILVGDAVRHEDVVAAIRSAAPSELTDIRLFDIFRGEGVGAGRKSMAYSLRFRSESRTLTDEEANRYHDVVKAALVSSLKAEIRES